MTIKNWYKSRIIWLGMLSVVSAALTTIIQGATWQQAVLAAVGALNILLRTQTDSTIKRKPKPAP